MCWALLPTQQHRYFSLQVAENVLKAAVRDTDTLRVMEGSQFVQSSEDGQL